MASHGGVEVISGTASPSARLGRAASCFSGHSRSLRMGQDVLEVHGKLPLEGSYHLRDELGTLAALNLAGYFRARSLAISLGIACT